MNYELAKQLKDAGFPQGKSEHYYIDQNINTGIISEYDESFMEEREVDFPTLSELIEACGEGIMGIYFKSDNEQGKVCAWTRRWLDNEPNQEDKDVECFGHSPEEAVAKLWLRLNKLDK